MNNLLPKLARDSGTLVVATVFLLFLFYALRRVDPAATVDGLANLFLAIQIIIIGFASASASGAIHFLLFGMLGRQDSQDLCASGWIGWATVTMYRCTWLVIFFLLFSRAVGH